MRPLTPGRYFGWIFASAALVVVVIALSPGIGPTGDMGPWDAWRAFHSPAHDSTKYIIAFELRLPRTLLALQSGMTLGLCGAVFQILFRNPLATPYTLGVSSGGTLGAVIALKLGLGATLLGMSGVAVASFVGALLVIGVVFVFARGSRRLSTTELLLAGVTMGLFCSAMIMLVTYLSTERQTFDMVRWMMGSVKSVGPAESVAGAAPLALCWFALLTQGRALNQYMIGDEIAASRGVSPARLHGICILFCSLATAIVVATCGPIGFVGLVVPQIVALILGRDCRLLLPCSALMGGVFLAVCDWLAQIALGRIGQFTGRSLSGAELPTGVVTAIIGVPIFLALLRRRAR